MKKIYILPIVVVILLFTAGIYAISNDIGILNTSDTQNNNVVDLSIIVVYKKFIINCYAEDIEILINKTLDVRIV